MRSEGEGLAGLSPFFRARRRWAFLALLMPIPRSFIHFARFSASIRPSYAFPRARPHPLVRATRFSASIRPNYASPTLVRPYYAFGGPWMRSLDERMKAARQTDERMAETR